VRAIRAIKADDESLKLQKEFYEKSVRIPGHGDQ